MGAAPVGNWGLQSARNAGYAPAKSRKARFVNVALVIRTVIPDDQKTSLIFAQLGPKIADQAR